MSVKQYLYSLEVLTLIDNGQDADGNNIPPTETWCFYSKCRDENSTGKPTPAVDGTMVNYSFLIQLPKNVKGLIAGTNVRVIHDCSVRVSGKVINSREGQLHTQVWV